MREQTPRLAGICLVRVVAEMRADNGQSRTVYLDPGDEGDPVFPDRLPRRQDDSFCLHDGESAQDCRTLLESDQTLAAVGPSVDMIHFQLLAQAFGHAAV